MNAEARMNPALERPQRSHPQHLQALERANAVRLARAELKRRVADREITAAEVILSSPWEAASMTVSDLLTSQHRWGHTRCRKFLQCIPMSVAQLLIAGDAAAQVPGPAEPVATLHPVLAAV
jgi:hypothetical protein